MVRSFFRLKAILLAVSLVATSTLLAQDSQPTTAERIRALEERLDQLDREARAIREALDGLKAPETVAESDDLTAVETVEKPPADVASTEVVEELPTEVVANAPSPAASKVFNPDISLVGNIVAHLGDENPAEERDNFSFDETEIAFESFVDPYAKAKIFLGISEEGIELEEGFVNFIALPWDLTAKVGKFKQSFGKVNTFHGHNLPWVDLPLVSTSFFGEEGLSDAGISVSRIYPTESLFVETTLEVASGGAEDIFERESDNDLSYLGRLRLYRDLSDNSNLELGTSFIRGTVAEAGKSQFGGVDLTWRWKPLERSIYRSLLARAEVMVNDRDDVDERALGYYASADYQFARRWFAGARYDSVERPDDPSIRDRGASLVLTFWPSEFSQLRGQFRRTDFGDGEEVDELLLQLQFSIGAHGVHPF
jgi:hypothetical protein